MLIIEIDQFSEQNYNYYFQNLYLKIQILRMLNLEGICTWQVAYKLQVDIEVYTPAGLGMNIFNLN